MRAAAAGSHDPISRRCAGRHPNQPGHATGGVRQRLSASGFAPVPEPRPKCLVGARVRERGGFVVRGRGGESGHRTPVIGRRDARRRTKLPARLLEPQGNSVLRAQTAVRHNRCSVVRRSGRLRRVSAAGSHRHRTRRGPAEIGVTPDRICAPSRGTMDDSRRAASFGAFLQSTDSYWPSVSRRDRDAPIFADHADRRAFYSCGTAHGPHVGAVDRSHQADPAQRSIRLDVEILRRLACSTDRACGGRSGIFRARRRAWRRGCRREADGLWIDEESLAAGALLRRVLCSFSTTAIFTIIITGWSKGCLSWTFCRERMGPDSNLKIALPKSMDIAAVFDHRRVAAGGRPRRTPGRGGRGGSHQGARGDLGRQRSRPDHAGALSQGLSARSPPATPAYAGPSATGGCWSRGEGRRGTIHNLEQVQTLLSRYDFETVYLEGMSMVGSDPAVPERGVHHRSAWRRLGQSSLLRTWNQGHRAHAAVEMRPFFWLISTKLDLVHGMQFCATTDGEAFQASISVDVGKLQALIRMLDAHY